MQHGWVIPNVLKECVTCIFKGSSSLTLEPLR